LVRSASPKPLADAGRFGELRLGIGKVAAHDRLARGGEQEMAAFSTRLVALVEQPGGASHPPCGLRHVTFAYEDQGDPRGDPAGLSDIASLDESLMRPHQERRALGVFADQVGRRGEFKQPRRFQR
jgi:hypothetical protein